MADRRPQPRVLIRLPPTSVTRSGDVVTTSFEALGGTRDTIVAAAPVLHPITPVV